ncbi:cytochrome P450 89A2-like [Rutidosis leptorrhynchoides]|uniref:cytochrome P450 89A2-like n=1 Tax=Rutidosis leptorrhynchoides TaxID=125765 RepID=UPI003A99C1B7
METIILISIFISISTLIITSLLIISHKNKLPPGPSFFSSNFILLTTSLSLLQTIVKNFKYKYGPLFTLYIGSHPCIFVSSHSVAHELLIQKGVIFADRPKTLPVRNISSALYGPTWRLFRKNLASEILHPSRVKSYAWARKWVLGILITRLHNEVDHVGIKVVDHFHYAMFSLLVLTCFGEKLDESHINEIASLQRRWLLFNGSGGFDILNLFPKLGKILFRNRWKELLKLRNDQEKLYIPLIKTRIEGASSKSLLIGDEKIVAYVDTLVKIQLPNEDNSNEKGEKLTYKEMVSMCDEFLNGGTDTTTTALQWIMANLVKYPRIQSKLFDEIVAVVGPPPQLGEELETVINVDEIQKMAYLKAVVLEGLRRHPPGHFVLPHRVMKKVEVEGYVVPEGATINFMVAEMGWDPKVWDDPMEFKPERFMENEGVFDISGSKGIKMMPFGVGRRMCPGYDLALLHLEYFVANMVWYFDWAAPDGYNVDLAEKAEFTVVMKNPLQAHVALRAEKLTT